MEQVIASLVKRYESGSLTRRELIQGLAMLAGAGAAAGTASAAAVPQAAASSPADAPLQAISFDHISVQTKDLEKSAEFYKSVFGLTFLNEDKAAKTIRLTVGNTTNRLAIRGVEPFGTVDHFAFEVKKFDKPTVIEKLKKMGVEPLQGPEPLLFHVLDPDGYPVQIISARS